MLVVIALGRTTLLEPGQPLDAAAQRAGARATASMLAAATGRHDLVITHGSAPQVGLLAYESAMVPGLAGYPLDVVEAETEGLLGYLLQQELANAVRERDVVTLLTQVVVDAHDPAFDAPSKLVGPRLAEVDAERLVAEHGWTVKRDASGWRRAVPSPEPLAVVERRALQLLVAAGVVVICAGGGGIPVLLEPDGSLRGVDAVIDKDLSAALVASLLGADLLVLLTDVAAVWSDWGTAFARPIHRASPAHLRSLGFEAGSMAPKVAAACRFAERTGNRAAIGLATDLERLLSGDAGTQVAVDVPAMSWHDISPSADVLLAASSPWERTS